MKNEVLGRVKSGVTAPANDPNPLVANRSDPGVGLERLLNVKDLGIPSLVAVSVVPPVDVSKGLLSCISMNCTLPLAFVKLRLVA